MSSPLTVAISIQQRVRQWQIPESSVRVLKARFPDVVFTHARTEAERAAALASAEVAYTWRLSAGELALAPRLRWVHSSAVAVDWFCLPELSAGGVRVSNTRGVQAVPIAEHVLAVLLALAKQLPFALENQAGAIWAQDAFAESHQPWLLNGRTLGLIGLGNIGQALAARASALGMSVLALRRQTDAPPVSGVSAVYGRDRLHEMLGHCDVLAIVAPLTPHTGQLIDGTALAALKPGAIVINVGRAAILDTGALIHALRSGRLGGAALDVFPEEPLPPTDPLWTTPNVLLTPHTSGFRNGHWDEVIDVFSDNLRRYLQGEPLRFEVNPSAGY